MVCPSWFPWCFFRKAGLLRPFWQECPDTGRFAIMAPS
jgi:hypothetical protein